MAVGDWSRTCWRCEVDRTAAAPVVAVRVRATRLAPTSARRRKTPSGTSGAGTRVSISTKVAISAPPIPNAAAVSGDATPASPAEVSR